MNTSTRREFLQVAAALPLSALVLGVTDSPTAPAGSSPGGYWEKLPYPSDRIDDIRDVALDKRNRLWVMSTEGISYWDGERYHVPQGEASLYGGDSYSFFGGPDRGIFFVKVFRRSERNDENRRYGEVYRLDDAQIKRVASLHHDMTRVNPCLYVSPDGNLYHWGEGFLAFHAGDGWERIEAKLAAYGVRVVETGSRIHFLCLRDQFLTTGQFRNEPPARSTIVRPHSRLAVAI